MIHFSQLGDTGAKTRLVFQESIVKFLLFSLKDGYWVHDILYLCPIYLVIRCRMKKKR